MDAQTPLLWRSERKELRLGVNLTKSMIVKRIISFAYNHNWNGFIPPTPPRPFPPKKMKIGITRYCTSWEEYNCKSGYYLSLSLIERFITKGCFTLEFKLLYVIMWLFERPKMVQVHYTLDPKGLEILFFWIGEKSIWCLTWQQVDRFSCSNGDCVRSIKKRWIWCKIRDHDK